MDGKPKKEYQEKDLEKERDRLFSEKMEIVNGKLNLLVTKEQLVEEEWKEVRKRKADQNLDVNNQKNLKENKSDIETYNKVLDFSGNKNRNLSFMPTVMVRLKVDGIVIRLIKGFLDTGAESNLMQHRIIRK